MRTSIHPIFRMLIAVVAALVIIGLGAGMATKSGFVAIFFVLLILSCWTLEGFWSDKCGQRVLAEWASSNGFRLVSREHRSIMRGPFWWRNFKSETVYYVDVINADGDHNTGYVRVNDGFLEVEWDKPDALYGPKGFPVLSDRAEEKIGDNKPS